MGFFSADCTGCGHPLLSEYATNDINNWMQQGVTIFEDGSIVKGTYDGYGRYIPAEGCDEPFEDVVDGTVWHEPCWRKAGSPTDYRGVSNPSEDQGYFFDDPTHDMPEPVSEAAPGAATDRVVSSAALDQFEVRTVYRTEDGREATVVFDGPEHGPDSAFRPVNDGRGGVRIAYLNADGTEPDLLDTEYASYTGALTLVRRLP